MSTITIKTDNQTLINILIGACNSISGTQVKVKNETKPPANIRYNPRILAAVERDRAGITEGDVRYSSIEDMCAAFGINPDDIK